MHPIKDYSYKEARFLKTELVRYKNLYIHGVGVKALARQTGLSRNEFISVMQNYDTLIEALTEQEKKLDRRDSIIFEPNYVREVLIEKQEEILDYFCEGAMTSDIYVKIGILPTKRVWNGFLTRIKKEGYDPIDMRKWTEELEQQYELEMAR